MLKIPRDVVRHLVGPRVYNQYLEAVKAHREAVQAVQAVLKDGQGYVNVSLTKDGDLRAKKAVVEVSDEFCEEVFQSLFDHLNGEAGYAHIQDFYPCADDKALHRTRSALSKMRKQKRVSSLGGDRWALSKHSLSRPETETHRYLAENYEKIREDCKSLVSRKFGKSRQMGLVDDHVQEFITHMLEKDTVSRRTKSGKGKPSSSSVAWWCTNHVTTEIRSWGCDASLQGSRGALTERGYEKRQAHDLNDVPYRDSYTKPVAEMMSQMEDTSSPDVEREIYLAKAYALVEEEIDRLIPNAKERYKKVAEMYFLKGYKVGEIARAEGVTMARASIICRILGERLGKSRKLRGVLQDALANPA